MSQFDGVSYFNSSVHKATVIWLHGLGDSGDGFAPVAPHLALPDELGVKFLFPHAPVQAVTINGGMEMRAWYDIKSLDLDKRADAQGVQQSAQCISALIDEQIAAGIPADKIILAGFSQGGVISLHLAPRYQHKLAGVMALSTYMSQPELLAEQAIHKDLTVFMAHGEFDNVVPLAAGKQAYECLQEQGMAVSWQTYAMAHQVCEQELEAIRQWLIERLS
ncbi:alpha/beta fold hydrolase [Pseudoalteromonas sp. BDTF-M6]|uniref:alpha/beta hydrolase n=1 Tax=Pseudoalteromonas sp. BDTF-M6 TaxID=2796132 RepID=UPI001BAEB7DF|nr:alpha/beta fold hydrolase [Pseudoalteromonas sp. BDTF-M6]